MTLKDRLEAARDALRMELDTLSRLRNTNQIAAYHRNVARHVANIAAARAALEAT
jgi:hypothetical protein